MIEDKIREYGQKRNTKALQEYVEKLETDNIIETITKRINHADFLTFWEYLMQGFTDKRESHDKRYKIIIKLLSILKEREVSAQLSNAIVRTICVELPKFKTDSIVNLSVLCAENIHQGNVSDLSWKELLPETLNVILERENIEHNDISLTGTEYKTQFISSLCLLQWSPNIVIPLTAMFIDTPLLKEEHLKVVNKLGQYMEKLTPQEIPAFVYQMLKLCRYQNSRSIFLRLQNFFGTRVYNRVANFETNTESMDLIGDASDDDVIQAESTVLFHIYQSALLGHESIKDYLASLKHLTKSPEFILHPFQLTVLLTISTVSFYEDRIFEIVRSSISRSYHEERRKAESCWFREMVPSNAKIENVLKQIIQNSVKERDLVLQGLVNFAFVLLNVGSALGRDTIAEKQWELGKFILLNLVKEKRHIAPSVLQRLCNHIITGHNVAQYIDCFHVFTKKFALLTLENKNCVVELMEGLLQVSEAVASQILDAVIPLTKVSPTIRDHLILLLRKALYSRVIDTRQMAVKGFLKLLKHLKISNLAALSQLSNSSSSSSGHSILTQISLNRTGQTAPSAFTNEALCLEVLTILRRCFMQQAEVRSQLYEGLYDVVCMNPEIGGPILDMLWSHFNSYYVLNKDTLPPLVFTQVTLTKDVDVVLQEPLGKLIYAIALIMIKVLEVDDGNESALRFVDILQSLCIRMANCELIHLELDDGTNLLDILPESQQKLLILKETMCVYEALIGYKMCSWCPTSENNAQEISSLFQGYFRLSQFLKNLTKPKKSDKKKKDADKTTQQTEVSRREAGSKTKALKVPNSILDFQVLGKFLNLLHSTVKWTTVAQANTLKTKHDIHRHVMLALIQLLLGVKSQKNLNAQTSKMYYSYCTEIGTVLYERCIDRLEEFMDFDASLAILAVECFHIILQSICLHYKENLCAFLSIVGSKDKDEDLIDHLSPFIETYQKLFELEDDSPTDETKRMYLLIANTLALLASQIPFETNVLSGQFLEWLKEFGSKHVLTSKPVATSFITLWFNTYIKFKSAVSLFETVVYDLSSVMGTIEEKDCTKEFKLINELSAHSTIPILTNTIKVMLEDINSIITRLGSEYAMITYPGEEGLERKREYLKSKERGVCCQLCLIITLLNSLSNILVPTGMCSEAVLKILGQIFNTLYSLTKYFIMRSSKVNVVFQGARFERVVKLAGKQLAPNVNKFILYIEESQKEETENTQVKKKSVETLKSKVLKETKLIPKVVFEIEQFGKSVIQLSNKTKVDLAKFIGPGTTRDFRIKDIKEVMEKLDRENGPAPLDTSNDDSNLANDSLLNDSRSGVEHESDDEDAPPRKKSKN